ncbi:MAG TPA: SRPBCC family protein [Chitinophagaceae bacterium]|jgi:ligand-binding SRPBCC domain-containing protein|nr:SRPBCC family protein [Chitinophagaceae bacterium]
MYTLQAIQNIPASIEAVWNFFADPNKLHLITPAYMKFRVISNEKVDRIYKGQLIEYKIKPILGIPLYWMTEITEVKDKTLFIDEQRKGPYKLWRHQHFFKEIPGGVEMTDLVEYSPPLLMLGKMANSFFLRKQLNGIFRFRYQKIEEIFGKFPVHRS